MSSAQKLEIRLLGEPEVTHDGQVLALPASKKSRALLGYLVRTGRPVRRERLCTLLWDGPDDPRAGLRWSLAKLRPLVDVGAVRLVADRERVAFEPSGADIDVDAIQSLARVGVASADTEALEGAVARFRGAFLEGLELSSCPLFHAWCVAEREALRSLHVTLLTTLVERRRAEPARALVHARALAALDPLAESPRLLLMDLLAALGESRRALDEYEDYARTLRRELDTAPSLELEKRRMALGRAPRLPPRPEPRDAREAPRSSEGSPSAAAVSDEAPRSAPPSSLAAPPRSTSRRPLVGREGELSLLVEWLDGAGRGAPVLLVSGEPGIGKTRLLEEGARLARERSGEALFGRAFEAELVRPYGAFIDALQSALWPESGDGARSRSPFSAPGAERGLLYGAVLEGLRQRAGARAPLVLVLDDLQWFDEASAELLHFIARGIGSAPILLATSARPAELEDNRAAERLVRALGRERLVRRIDLGPMSADELKHLVGPHAPASALERALEDAAGNPLFALEAARALEAGSEDLVGSLSRLIGERLARLQDSDRTLLSWAAALGRSFDVDVLAQVTAMPVPELLASLERLERHAILQSRESGYDFGHDLVRRAAYRQMSSPRQRLVHAQIARTLAAAPDPDGALAGDVAHHAALAGDAALAARACVSAGRRCLRIFAARQARELAQRGLQLARSLPDPERVTLEVELVAIEIRSDPDPRTFEAQVERLCSEARALGLSGVEARALFLRSLVAWWAGDSRLAFESSLERVEAARLAGPEARGKELAGAARCFMNLERNVDYAAQFVAEAEALLEGEQLELVIAQGLLARHRDEPSRASERLERALSLARRDHAHWEECECLLELCWIDFDRDRPESMRARAEALAAVAAKLGEGAHGPCARCLVALADWAQALREGQGSDAPVRALDVALGALDAASANRLMAAVLSRAATLAQRAHERALSVRYAEATIACAERVQCVNAHAHARALLAELALDAGDERLAARHLDQLAELAVSPDLSAQSQRSIARVRTLARARRRQQSASP